MKHGLMVGHSGFPVAARHRDLVQVGREGGEAMPSQVHRMIFNLDTCPEFATLGSARRWRASFGRRPNGALGVFTAVPLEVFVPVTKFSARPPKKAREPRALPKRPLVVPLPSLIWERESKQSEDLGNRGLLGQGDDVQRTMNEALMTKDERSPNGQMTRHPPGIV